MINSSERERTFWFIVLFTLAAIALGLIGIFWAACLAVMWWAITNPGVLIVVALVLYVIWQTRD